MNIYDYVKWRGDVPMSQSPFNELDSLFLTQLPYLDWTSALTGRPITLQEASWTIERQEELIQSDPERYELALLAADTMRFGGIRIIDYTRILSQEQELQFCAMFFQLPDHTYYIAYEGTETSLIGWKENFNMTYMCPTAGQKAALEYLNQRMNALRSFHLGGHSKGGNLAFYAAVLCTHPHKIIEAHSFDGPGFSEDFLNKPEYLAMKDKLTTWIPQSSVIGRLLNNNTQTYIVKSSGDNMLFQHNVLSWEVDFNRLYTISENTRGSGFMEEVFDDWNKGLTTEQKIVFINTTYDTLMELGYTSARDIFTHPTRVMAEMTTRFISFPPTARSIVLNVLAVLLKCNVKSFYNNYLDSLLKRRNEDRK